jgi:hypothetical protein
MTQPSEQNFLKRLLRSPGMRPCSFTQKAESALLRAIELAREHGAMPSDNELMCGLIQSRSVAIPVLDTMDIDPLSYHTLLKQDSQALADHFHNELYSEGYKDLSKAEHIRGHSLYRIVYLAASMADRRTTRVIDSALLMQALFQQLIYARLEYPDDIVNQLAERTLSEQLQEIGEAPDSGLLHDETTWRDVTIEDAMDRNHEIQGFPDGDFISFYTLVNPLAPLINTLGDFAKLEGSLKAVRTVEPYLDYPNLHLLSQDGRIIIREASYLNTYNYKELGEPSACKISTFVSNGILTWDEIEQFEDLLNRDDVSEWDIQRFLMAHNGFLLGSDYSRLHSQVALLSDGGERLIPDFFAERIGNAFADIIELKKPSARLTSGPPRRRGFSAELTRALNQLRQYRNFFDDTERRREFHKLHGFQAFRPSMTVVIGRSSDYQSDVERIQIEDEYKNLRVLTYDDILRRAKRLAVLV